MPRTPPPTVERPPKCDACDENRHVTLPDGRVARCRCHPLHPFNKERPPDLPPPLFATANMAERIRRDREERAAWINFLRHKIRERAALGRAFTASDLWRSGVAKPPHPRWPGIAFMNEERRGTIMKIGQRRSPVRSRAGGTEAIWIGTGGAR